MFAIRYAKGSASVSRISARSKSRTSPAQCVPTGHSISALQRQRVSPQSLCVPTAAPTRPSTAAGRSPAPPAHLPSPPMSPSRRVLPAAKISTSKRSNHLRHACVIRLAARGSRGRQVDKTPVVARRSYCRRRTPLVVLRASDDGPITSLSTSTGAVIRNPLHQRMLRCLASTTQLSQQRGMQPR